MKWRDIWSEYETDSLAKACLIKVYLPGIFIQYPILFGFHHNYDAALMNATMNQPV